MSLNLYYIPHRPTNAASLPDALKMILRRNPDWFDSEGVSVRHVASEDDVPYLRGLRDAGVAGAEELLDAIERHGAVVVYTE